MNKETVKKLLKGEKISQEAMINFIFDYVKQEKNIEPTPQQITGIIQAINMGVFTLDNAIEKVTKQLGLEVVKILNTSGIVTKINIYESN